MSEDTAITGRCLCGAVRFTAAALDPDLGACHCSMCRRWGGGPLLAVDCGSEVEFEGAEHVRVFDSSNWAERGFCAQCGSHLFYRFKGANRYVVPVGLLDRDPGVRLEHQVFIDEKPAYYHFAERTRDMTGAEVFAKYAPPSPPDAR